MWLFQNYVSQNSGILGVTAAVKLCEPADLPALNAAVEHAVDRHPALRTIFPSDESGTVRRVTLPAGDPRLQVVVDVAELAPDESIEDALSVRAGAWRDATCELPWEVALLRADGIDVVSIVLNHLISDSHSVRVFVGELMDTYAALRHGTPLPAALEGVVDEVEPDGDPTASLDYWREQLSAARRSVRELAIGRTGARDPGLPGDSLLVPLSDAAQRAVGDIARRTACPQSAVVLAAFATVLDRLSVGAGDAVIVGMPFYGRGTRGHDAIGYYANIVAARVPIDDDLEVDDYVRGCASVLLAALAHSDVAVDDLSSSSYDNSSGEGALVRYLYNYVADAADDVVAPETANEVAGYIEVAAPRSRLDLDLAVFAGAEGLELRAVYAADVFTRDEIVTLLAWIDAALVAAAAGGRVGELDVYPAPEATTDADDEQRLPLSVLNEIATSAFVGSAAPAVEVGSTSVDYGTLLTAVADTADRLAGAGIGAGDRLTLSAPSPLSVLVVLLAAWSRRAVIVLPDPVGTVDGGGPDAGPVTVIGAEDIVLPAGSGAATPLLDLADVSDVVARLVPPAADDDALARQADLSTLTHRQLAVAVSELRNELAIAAHDRVAVSAASLTYADASPALVDVLAALAAMTGGATVCPAAATDDPVTDLLDLLVDGATVVVSAPLVLDRLLDRVEGRPDSAAAAFPEPARTVLLRGDRAPAGLASRAARAGLRVVRATPHYVAGLAAVGPLPDGDDAGEYAGRATAELAVFDARGRSLPVGVRGTPTLRGQPLRAYPVEGTPQEVAVRLGPGRTLLLDRPVEEATWERLLERDERVRRAVVLGDERPRAWVESVAAGPGAAEAETLARSLHAELERARPDASHPDIVVDDLPTNSYGIVDRQRLEDPDRIAVEPSVPAAETTGDSSPAGSVADRIDVLGLFQTLLDAPDLGPLDDFFAHGGTSMIAAKMVAMIKRQTGLRVPLKTVLRSPTATKLDDAIAALASR